MTPTLWDKVIDRYGLPVAVLAVFALAFYKLIWPLLLQQIKESRQFLVRQNDEMQARMDKSQEAFLLALQRRDEIMQRGFQRLDERLGDRLHDKAAKKRPKP